MLAAANFQEISLLHNFAISFDILASAPQFVLFCIVFLYQKSVKYVLKSGRRNLSTEILLGSVEFLYAN
jgi:hypothetical protein